MFPVILKAIARGVRNTRVTFGRGRVRAAEQATLDELAFLSDAGLVLSSSLEPQRIVDMLASLAVPRLGDVAMLFLRSDDKIELAAVVHTDPTVASYLRSLVAERPPTLADDVPPGFVLRTGQTWYLPLVTDEMARSFLPDSDGHLCLWRARMGPSVTVAMPGRGRVLGALTLARKAGDYSPVEITLAEHLARRGAAALDNAQLFRGVQESALTLQRSLLPGTPPAIDGVDIAMEYRPGTVGTEVGGDLYDVIPLSGGRVGVAIGDVMGRGLRAAAVMGQLRAALRAYALEGWGPAALLSRLDRVVNSLPGLQMATSLYVVYDPGRNRVTLANAGHLPPLLVLTDEEPDYLVLDPGLPLGVGDDVDFSETTLTLPPGSSLVLFTDGLVESRRVSLTDGMDRLRLGLSRAVAPAFSGAESSARALLERCLLAASHSAQTDDDTALLVLSTYPVRPPLLEVPLPADATSAGRARSELAQALSCTGLAALREDALLLASEIVTNAVLHARSDFVLRATVDLGRLRVSVEDREGATLPCLLDRAQDADSGWGLLLVEALSDAWGVEMTPRGKRVWFDLVLPTTEGTCCRL